LKIGKRAIKIFFISIIIILFNNPLGSIYSNTGSNSVIISKNLKIQKVCQYDFGIIGSIVEDNLLFMFKHKSILVFDISDICSIKLVENFTSDLLISCLAKKGSYIYAGSNNLLILKWENVSLELLAEIPVINGNNETISSIRSLDINENLMIVADYRQIVLFDLANNYIPTFILSQEYFWAIIDAYFCHNYILSEPIDPCGFQGVLIQEFNRTTNSLNVLERLSSVYSCIYYENYLYACYRGRYNYLVRYNIDSLPSLYVDSYFMLEYYREVRNLFHFYDDYGFLYQSGTLYVYDIENYSIKRTLKHEFDYEFTTFRILNDFCFFVGKNRTDIYELASTNTMEFGISNKIILYLTALFIIGFYCKKRKTLETL